MLDTSGYVPRHVRDSAELLAGAAGRYVFVSSISYYADYREPRTETDPPEQLGDKPDDRLLEDYSNYGALKALCEQEVERGVRRPGDPRPAGADRRPERPDRPLHLLAAPGRARRADPRPARTSPCRWSTSATSPTGRSGSSRTSGSGPYNATSPPRAITFDSMLEACGAADVVRVTEEFLAEQGVEGWSDLPCWIPLDRRRLRGLPARAGRPRGRRRADLPAARRDRPGRPRVDGQGGADAGARGRAPGGMGESRRVSLDVAAARARFTALQRELVFFDAPGGSQVPDEVIDAIAALPARVERERQRPVRDEPPHRGARRACARERRRASSAARRRRSSSART